MKGTVMEFIKISSVQEEPENAEKGLPYLIFWLFSGFVFLVDRSETVRIM